MHFHLHTCRLVFSNHYDTKHDINDEKVWWTSDLRRRLDHRLTGIIVVVSFGSFDPCPWNHPTIIIYCYQLVFLVGRRLRSSQSRSVGGRSNVSRVSPGNRTRNPACFLFPRGTFCPYYLRSTPQNCPASYPIDHFFNFAGCIFRYANAESPLKFRIIHDASSCLLREQIIIFVGVICELISFWFICFFCDWEFRKEINDNLLICVTSCLIVKGFRWRLVQMTGTLIWNKAGPTLFFYNTF